MAMADISGKDIMKRTAVASGKIFLSKPTIAQIREGTTKKGNPLQIAEIAAISAAKQTHILIPHCHQIPLELVAVNFQMRDECIEATCEVSATAKTGVEMEALVGAEIALATVWDMVKYLEKDKQGQYPNTRITDIMVLKKTKGDHGG
jgi:cyclic pyranopterin monophosphate synthase